MNEFKPINTQEEFDERISARLKRLNEKHAADLRGYEDLQKEHKETLKQKASLEAQIEDLRSKPMPDLYKERLEEKTRQIEELQRGWAADRQQLLRAKVGYKYSLPEVLIDRLHGTTEAEIEEDALFLAGLNKSKQKRSGVRVEFRANDPKPESDTYTGSLRSFLSEHFEN